MRLDEFTVTDLLVWHRWKTTVPPKKDQDGPATFVCRAGCKIPWEGTASTSYMEAVHKTRVLIEADLNASEQLEFVRDAVPEGRFDGVL